MMMTAAYASLLEQVHQSTHMHDRNQHLQSMYNNNNKQPRREWKNAKLIESKYVIFCYLMQSIAILTYRSRNSLYIES